MQPRFVLAPVLTLLLLAAATPADGAGEPGWQLRFGLAGLDFEGTSRVDAGGRLPIADPDFGGGVWLAGAYRVSPRLGLALGLVAGGGVDFRVTPVPGGSRVVTDTLSLQPLTAGLDIHLTPDAQADLRLTPFVAWIHYGDVISQVSPSGFATRVSVDDDLALGASLGLGIPIGQGGWSLEGEVSYFDSTLEGRAAGEVVRGDSEVLVFAAGAGYRF